MRSTGESNLPCLDYWLFLLQYCISPRKTKCSNLFGIICYFCIQVICCPRTNVLYTFNFRKQIYPKYNQVENTLVWTLWSRLLTVWKRLSRWCWRRQNPLGQGYTEESGEGPEESHLLPSASSAAAARTPRGFKGCTHSSPPHSTPARGHVTLQQPFFKDLRQVLGKPGNRKEWHPWMPLHSRVTGNYFISPYIDNAVFFLFYMQLYSLWKHFILRKLTTRPLAPSTTDMSTCHTPPLQDTPCSPIKGSVHSITMGAVTKKNKWKKGTIKP